MPHFLPLEMCQNWDILGVLATQVSLAFRRDALQAPTPGDSPQVKANRFNVLLSMDPWPGICEQFRREALPQFGSLVAEWRSFRPLELSFTQRIGEDLVIITIRNASSWYERRGESTTNSWQGYPIRHLKTLTRRLVPQPSAVCAGSSPDRGKTSSIVAGRELSDNDIQRVREAVRRLPRTQQRAVRLIHGWWPARYPWTTRSAAKYLGVPAVKVERLIETAYAELRDLLPGHLSNPVRLHKQSSYHGVDSVLRSYATIG